MNGSRIRNTLAAAAFCLTVCGSFGCTSQKKVLFIAEQNHAQLSQTVATDAGVDAYLDALLRRIQDGALRHHRAVKGEPKKDDAWMFGPEIQVHLVADRDFNAFTTGGRHIYIHSGLLAVTTCEEELAAVMSHELGHIYGKHIKSAHNRAQTVSAAAVAAAVAAGTAAQMNGQDPNEIMGSLHNGMMAAGAYVRLSMGRKDEHEADDFGWKFYLNSGWDPNKFGDMLMQLVRQEGGRSVKGGTHPAATERFARFQEKLRKLPDEERPDRRQVEADVRTFRQIQARALAAAANRAATMSPGTVASLLLRMPKGSVGVCQFKCCR